jgi:hypothetical protein
VRLGRVFVCGGSLLLRDLAFLGLHFAAKLSNIAKQASNSKFTLLAFDFECIFSAALSTLQKTYQAQRNEL